MSESTELTVTDQDLRRGGLPDNMKMAPGLAIYYVESLYQRSKAVALRMSEARGIVGDHLIGNPSACLAILSRAITWNLDPFAVAQATYAVKGKIGYEGKLCQAILENCGALEGQVAFEFFGPWEKIIGKFKMIGKVGSGDRKPEQAWGDDDEVGLGVRVSAQIRGEASRRTEEFFLNEMWPRNSVLWITRPKQQMRYATVRAFGSLAVPGIIMGIPFDVDPSGMGQDGPLDITPARPVRPANEFDRSPARDPAMGDWIVQLNAAEKLTDVGTIRAAGLKALPPELHEAFEEAADNRARQIGDAPAKTAQTVEPDGGAQDDPPDDSAKTSDESAFQHGQRLLQSLKVAADVADLRDSKAEELSGKALKQWLELCQVRFNELGGTGKLPKAGK